MRGAGVNAEVFGDSVRPILALGRAELVVDGHEVAPGMVMRAAPGHTPGQMLLDLANDGDRALFTGDIIHHPMQIIRPDWNSVYCEDGDQARETRRIVLEDAASTGARVVPAHFGGSHSAFVIRGSDGFRPVFA
jgi:glyoxylase-like metal-dependent hydrolase (beta-lactamase superfamily II)